MAKFVEALVKDPANPPQVKLLMGYAGEAVEKDHVRIYLDPELSEHLDVPQAAVLHTQDVPNDPLGAKHFWIDRNALISHKKAAPAETKSRFFAGPLTQGFAAAPADGATAAAPAAQVSINLPCPTPSFNPDRCPSDLGICPSVDICATQQPNCHSLQFHCPTLPVQLCPSSPLVCRTIHQQCHTVRPQDCLASQLFICNQTLNHNCHFTRNPGCIRTFVGTCASAIDACPSGFVCIQNPGGFGPLQ